MCVTCGCGGSQPAVVGQLGHHHDHSHHDDHGCAHGEAPSPAPADGRPAEVVVLEERVLAKNDALAEANRGRLAARGVLAVNVMSSPGAGKTTLLERTVRDVARQWPVAVLEGDQEGSLDAERIRASGAPVVQVNTGDGCHLDAEMFSRGLDALCPDPGSLVFVENVGNLVCPALFDLGENARVVVMAVTEGEDKPLKYSRMFASVDLVVINKCDLLEHVEFDLALCEQRVRRASPAAEILRVSARTGEGLPAWYAWLRHRAPAVRRTGGATAAAR